jgi:hypothetical protein
MLAYRPITGCHEFLLCTEILEHFLKMVLCSANYFNVIQLTTSVPVKRQCQGSYRIFPVAFSG